MSQIEKIIRKFISKPKSVKYCELERILFNFNFDLLNTKGSHKKYKNEALKIDIIIPVHNNKCKSFYKEQVHKKIKHLLKKYEN